MNIIRYINGKKVEEKDLIEYELDSDVILKTIKAVNERLKNDFHQGKIKSQSS